MLKQSQPSSVNKSSRQGGEARADKWAWVEATVWTERMLKALEKGVKGGKWFSLMDSGRGADHQRWPIAFFREQGLFTLSAAYDSLCQSRCGPH